MDLRLKPDAYAFRSRLREWLDRNAEHARFPKDPLGALAAMQDWQRRLYEAGYVGLAWPRWCGGQEATLIEQVIVSEELARAAPSPLIGTIGLDILGPTLIRHGTDAQRERFLPRILTAEELWCQGFSEPDAGSDLPALRTRAVLDGDRFLVYGHKLWTSLGPIADFCFLLARTDPDAPKRDGISFLLCDMRTPGVTVRPLRNAAGGSHFSEITFDEVEIPRDNLVGELHGGWQIARTSLDQERSGLSGVVGLERTWQRLWRKASESPVNGVDSSRDLRARDSLVQHWIELEGLRYLGYRTLTAQLCGEDPGPQAAVGKLFASEFRQRLAKTALALQGSLAQVVRSSPHAIDRGRWQIGYLDALGYTIGGGTSEVMRNTIAERVLGLPRSADD